MRKTTQISIVSALFITGLGLGRAGMTAGPLVLAASGLAITLSWHRRLFLVCLGLAALTLGLWRASAWTDQQARLTELIGQTVTITGTVSDDPSVGANRQVDFKLGHLHLSGQPLPGILSVHLYPVQVQRGYQLQLTGTVRPGFGNVPAELSYPQLQILSRQQDWLERLRQRFFVGIRTALPEPIASFGLGLLVGIRALIPKPMQSELALVGLSHLVAVSGYNLTIIVAAADRLLHRFGRGIALAGSLWLIAGFLIVTGGSASIVRASLVSVLSLLAAFYGRRFDPLVLILVTAGLTAAYNPAYLTDLGWLLSYLAFFGILVLAPAIEAQLGHPKLVVVRLAIESTSAQILTLPLILGFFSQLSIVAPLTNLIILPLVPLAMAVSFLAGLAGMIMPAFAGWLAWPATIVLRFITGMIDQFAALPWAGRTDHLSTTAMLAAYGLLAILTAALHRSNARTKVCQNSQTML